MKISIITCNSPRHLNLIKELSMVADDIYVIQECKTIFLGSISDFYRKSEVMEKYFALVYSAEKQVFGNVGFLPSNVKQVCIKNGDISHMDIDMLPDFWESDIYIVFGSSYIKGVVADELIKRNAINIHMGVSPFYRGTSCNFWALFDGKPELVGATIHYLSKGLDSGDILYHALPKAKKVDPFILGMEAVRVAQQSLKDKIADGGIFNITPKTQDKVQEYRYAKNDEFTDDIAEQYMSNLPTSEYIYNRMKNRDRHFLVNPYIG